MPVRLRLPANQQDVGTAGIHQGAAGVDMGRNIFQSERPAAMLRAIRGVVHEGLTPAEALDVFNAELAPA